MNVEVANGDIEGPSKPATNVVDGDNKIESVTDVEKGESGEEEGRCGERSLKGMIVQGVAGSSIILNIVAIAIEASAITAIAGVFAILIGPIVMFYQLKLQDTDSMRRVQNALRQDVNRLKEENNKMVAEIDELEVQVAEMRVQEKRLDEITAAQGINATAFVQLVKENRELLNKQESVVRHETAQLLSSVVINSDGNFDGKYNQKELRELEVKLRALPNVTVDGKFLKDRERATMAALLKFIDRIVFHKKEGGEGNQSPSELVFAAPDTPDTEEDGEKVASVEDAASQTNSDQEGTLRDEIVVSVTDDGENAIEASAISESDEKKMEDGV